MALLFFSYANAQINVSGKVLSDENELLAGVNIIVKGTAQGTTTDADGAFKLLVPDASSVLVVSFVGYVSEEITVGNQTNIEVRLMPDIAALQEVVIIGYGVQKKEDVTGAVVRVKSEDFQVGKIQDATDLVKGKVAGLVITKGSGDPNATSGISLRGITTIEGNTQPLILINGVPGDLTSVAPENVESVDVLKDASAAAIYGTRGANGVILITTKSGKRDKPVTVNYTGYGSMSEFSKEADFMGPDEVRRGLTSFSDGGWDTDWVKAVTQKGYMTNHSITVDGGAKNSAYSANFSYRYEEGTIKRSDNEQYRIQFNLDQYLFNDIVKLNMNVLREYRVNAINTASADGLSNIYRQATIRNPTSPVYDEVTGKYDEDFNRFQYYNPVSMVNELIGDREMGTMNLIGNITVEPISRWRTNLMLSQNLYTETRSSYATSNYYTSVTSGFPGSANKGYSGVNQKSLELTSTYDFSIDAHRVSFLAGYSYFYVLNDGFSAGNADFPTDSYLYNNIGLGGRLKEGLAGMGSFKNDATLISFFGRLQYDFGDRFNLLGSLRREGSSKFGSNHQWGLFPAVSAGWTISNENFMKSAGWIDNLKLRAGYGVTGRTPNDSYMSLTLFNYDAASGNFLNEQGNWVPGLAVSQNPNPDLKWETTAEVNVGVDVGFLNNRVFGSLDVYSRETNDLIYAYNVPLPPNIFPTTMANVGSMSNKGYEIMVGGIPVSRGDFEWKSSLTLSHNTSKLIKLSNGEYETADYLDLYSIGDPVSAPSHRWQEGKEMGSFWGLKSVGVTEDGVFLIEDPATGQALPYSTALNSDMYRQILGNGLPDLVLGWTNSFRYKGFDLNMLITGQFGFQILNQQRLFYENNSIQYNRLKSAADPVYGQRPLASTQAQAFVSYYLEDGDYVKFDNVTLGYNFGVGNINWLSKLRLYGSAQNFLILSDYKGLDPELTYNFATPNSDSRDKYPTIRSFTLGLNVTFK